MTGEDAGSSADDLPPAARPLRDRAGDAALFLDYDGTLAPIVDDPAGARPLPGAAEVLAELATRLAVVAVVSGRPARFLLDALGAPPGVRLAGLYGMEEVGGDGAVREDPEAARWRPTVEAATALLAAEAPQGAEVEAKGLSVTLHWRRAPAVEGWATEAASRLAERTGLVRQPGRMALELRPPVERDKGTVVTRMAAGLGVVGYVGDDAGDLPAFAALDRMAAAGVQVVRVAVADAESPAELATGADVVLAGPADVLALLRAVAADREGPARPS